MRALWWWCGLWFALLLLCSANPVAADSAEQLFARYEPALLQVRVLEKASGAKASIGTGFVLEQPNLLVTNYHVVSEAVLFPDKYQLEYLAVGSKKGQLKVVAVDVINDLALVSTDYQPEQRFSIQPDRPVQGATIYSLGNPHDLGMILVPGTYNGLQKYSFYPRIHFTGAVNAGMSGGPSVDAAGKVVGINVASAGNQLGFLVPSEALTALLQRFLQQGEVADFKQQIDQQLVDSQQKMFEQILNADWQLKDFGPGKVPDEVVPFVRCWGESNVEKNKDQLKKFAAFCSQSEEIFLSQQFTTGRIEMQFEWLHAPDLHPLQFFSRYQQNISNANPDNQAGKEDVTSFECQHQVVKQSNGQHAKTIFCVRAYRNFAGLFDALYLSASLDHDKQGLISHFTLSGVTQQTAQAFSRKFSEAVLWQ
jgi:serine protease Do